MKRKPIVLQIDDDDIDWFFRHSIPLKYFRLRKDLERWVNLEYPIHRVAKLGLAVEAMPDLCSLFKRHDKGGWEVESEVPYFLTVKPTPEAALKELYDKLTTLPGT